MSEDTWTPTEAVHFLQAGGQITPAFWRSLSGAEQAAFAAAGRALDVERALRSGLATTSPEVVRAEIDGGESYGARAFAEFCEGYVKGLSSAKV